LGPRQGANVSGHAENTAFYGYPMDALTKRALRNMSMTYPVVI
jgi:hypothetical protein